MTPTKPPPPPAASHPPTAPRPPAPATRIDPDALRTVPMPDLRTPEARLLDAAQRGLDGTGHKDVRTFDQVIIAEFVRLVDSMQALRLEFDLLREEIEKEREKPL